MTSLLNRIRGTGQGKVGPAGESPQQSPTEYRIQKTFSEKIRHQDPNAPLRRLQLHQKCLYERMFPGNAFVSAHVNRLQHGYYSSKALHEPALDDVFFVSVHFVFHPQDHRNHRFKRATIRVAIRGDEDPAADLRTGWYKDTVNTYPRILGHAPELLYGAVSPENLQWNFSLSSSLGVSHTPVTASVNPSGAVKTNYKIYDMMSIQGSIRSIRSPLGPEYDIEDSVAVWTLDENLLQRSGLPREFDFVLLVHKPEGVNNVFLTVDVDATIQSWLGTYPEWYLNLSRYQPTQDFELDFNTDIGQRFTPIHPTRGFNFADLPHPLDEYVTMPGTVYPTNDSPSSSGADKDAQKPKTFEQANGSAQEKAGASQQPSTPQRQLPASGQDPSANRHSWIPETVNVRVMLEHSSPQHSSSTRRYSGSPINNEHHRPHSLRRTRSRTGLKEYGAQQALHEIARGTLNGDAHK